MIKISDLKVGDYVIAGFDGKSSRGEVIDINREDGQAEVRTGEQEFWYGPEDLEPIPLDEKELLLLGFERQEMEDGVVKYLKGPFRVLVENGDFSHLTAWYREDRRHWNQPLMVHELQNHYLQMTKVGLLA